MGARATGEVGDVWEILHGKERVVSRGEQKGGLSGSWQDLCVSEAVYASETFPRPTQNGYSASSRFSLVEHLWDDSFNLS